MSFVDAFENAVLDEMLGTGATLLSGNLELALSTTTPADDGTNITEPVGGSYARESITNDVTNFAAASSGSKTNVLAITFTTATGDWGTITHWVLYDTSVAKIWGTLDDGAGAPQPRAVYNGDTFSFPTGQLRITLD